MAETLKKLHTEFLEHLEIEKGRSAKTIRNYDFYLRRFLGWSKANTPSQITAEVVRKYRLWINRDLFGRTESTLKKSTQNYHLIALRTFLTYLAKRDITSLAPEKIELSKQSARHVEYLEADELARMLEVPKTETLAGTRDRTVLETLFATGLRVSELSGLKIDQVNLKRDEFTVRGKGGKVRVVFLSDDAKVWLKKYLDLRRDASPYVFVSHDPAGRARTLGALTPRSVQRLVQGYAIKAGVTKRITPHVMRHTYATTLLRNGADIRSVQAMLGHSSITTTQIYTHVTDKTLRDVHKKFHKKS